MSSLKCTPVSGIVAQHIATSTSVLEVDDFDALAENQDYEDPVEDEEQIYDEDDDRVEEVFADGGVEDGEEEYVEDADDEYCDVDVVDSTSSVSEEEANADAVESEIAYEVAVDEEICESQNCDETEVIVPRSSDRGREKFRNASVKSRKATSKGLRKRKRAESEAGSSAATDERRPGKKSRKRDERHGSKKAKARKSQFERRNIRQIKDNKELEVATKLAQKQEMERLQRLQEIQEQVWQQAALDLRLTKPNEVKLPSPVPTVKSEPLEVKLEPPEVKSEPPEMKLETPVVLATTAAPTSFPTSAAMTDDDNDDNIEFLGQFSISSSTVPAALPHPVLCLPTPEPDVVEISSSDDEDDIQVVASNDDDNVDEDSDGETETSGNHDNDALNQRDASGHVLVNIGHPANEPDIFLAPQIAAAVKPHQIGGIRFLYDNVVESLERYKVGSGFGCILAHSMGLGKTLQVISFIDVFLRHTDARCVLIIVPVNTLQNWVAEFGMWLPVSQSDALAFCDAGQSGSENIPKTMTNKCWPRRFSLHLLNESMKTNVARAKVVSDWHETGGVLLLGYEMYRLLTTKQVLVKPRRPGKRSALQPDVINVDELDYNRELQKGFHEALTRPGPDLVICDEGHRIKNCGASTSRALKNIRTRRRVVLTGYPLQNNLLEYWCMVDFVRPNYLGNKTEFANMFERPIMNGQCIDSTESDVQLMRFRSHVLHKLLEGFVQRRSHAVLRTSLPMKEEHVFLIRMSAIQRKLYSEFMTALRASGIGSWASSNNPIKAFSVCCKIWNHPDVLYQFVAQRKEDNDLDLEDAKPVDGRNGYCSSPTTVMPRGQLKSRLLRSITTSSLDEMVGAMDVNKKDSVITYDWANELLRDYEVGVIEHSGKMIILMDIISQSIALHEKILVFSQSLFTLNLIEDYLSRSVIPNTEDMWMRNKNYFRLDGSTSGLERERLINKFNAASNNEVHLFLLSTRAGSLGINLVGASRVVVFDASWNPCHDCQAVCRIYRYGQTRSCHVYRLVSDNTMEKKIYNRQVSKQGVSDRIVDEVNTQTLLERRQIDVLLQYEDVELPSVDPTDCESGYSDEVLVNIIRRHHHWMTKLPFMHESLLLDQKDQKLTRFEKHLAQQGYERDKMMGGRPSAKTSSPARPVPRRPYSPPLSPLPYPPFRNDNSDSFSDGRWSQFMASEPPPYISPSLTNLANMVNPSMSQSVQLKPGVFVRQIQATRDIRLPSRIGEESDKISAGENILVIKMPKGLYIRTKKGRIYAVHSGNELSRSDSMSASAAWTSELPPYLQQSSQSAYAAASMTSMLGPWGSSNSVVDIYNSMQYSDTSGVTSVVDDDPYSARYMPQSCALSSSVTSSCTSSDVCDTYPMYSLNTTTSYNGNFAWNSSVDHQITGTSGRVVSDEVDMKVPSSHIQQQQVHQDRSGFTVNKAVQQSFSFADLPSDLLCIDASCVPDRTDISDSMLPALTVSDPQNDADSLDSLTFDVPYNCSSDVDPVFNGYHSSLYNTHSSNSATPGPSFSGTAATTGVLDVGDMSGTAADWSELSAMMNDTN